MAKKGNESPWLGKEAWIITGEGKTVKVGSLCTFFFLVSREHSTDSTVITSVFFPR